MDAGNPKPWTPSKRVGPTAPIPTKWTLFLRRCVLWQAVRFAAINLKMISMIRRSHH
ncbi:MAG: hypothetical protein LDL56_05180 [Armatimonadetes bacterium]|jgi:hypothetical protein|nr:hypothetical protein [Armatimonadota bacterium]MCA1996606.1 hypothetical protein [Armatimonadota bacterium]